MVQAQSTMVEPWLTMVNHATMVNISPGLLQRVISVFVMQITPRSNKQKNVSKGASYPEILKYVYVFLRAHLYKKWTSILNNRADVQEHAELL